MISKICITGIWLFFAILFFRLAWHHHNESKRTISDLEIEIPQTGIAVKIASVDFSGFVNNFNEYVRNQNESNRNANLSAYYGYCLAGLTALFAIALVWQGYIFAFLAKLVLPGKS